MSSDERLARRAAAGSRRAFEEIYRRYHQDLYRFCLAMVGNPQDAQDALQNTMVKALRALPGEEREIRLKPWLYRIARNESVEMLRRRRPTVELEPGEPAVAGVTETAESRERLRTLLDDLDRLPERQRATLVMRELSGLGFDQIGAALGTSPAVARQTLYEARLSLRQLEAGREMRCVEVTRALSDGDGRVTRRREIQAHLRSCAECRAFRDGISRRHEDLAALAPLPLAVSAGLLHGALGAGAGKALATSALAKSAATVAVVAVVGVSAADRSGVVDLPLPGRGDDAPARSAPPPRAAGEGEPSGGRTAVTAASRPSDSSASNEAGAAKPDSGAAPGETPGGDAGGAPRTGASDPGPSDAQAGTSPPGGGHGRSAAKRGRPENLPAASGKGQQTAAAHKPAHAASPLGQDSDNGGKGRPPGDEGAPAPKAPATAPAKPEPPAPVQVGGTPPQAGSGDAPPGLER